MLTAGKDHNNFISKISPALLDAALLKASLGCFLGFYPKMFVLRIKCTLSAIECIVATPTWHLGITGCGRREICNVGAQVRTLGALMIHIWLLSYSCSKDILPNISINVAR